MSALVLTRRAIRWIKILSPALMVLGVLQIANSIVQIINGDDGIGADG